MLKFTVHSLNTLFSCTGINGELLVTGQLSGTVSLTCQVQSLSSSEISYMWRRQNGSTLLTNSQKYTISFVNNTDMSVDDSKLKIYFLILVIRSLTELDEDVYTCVTSSNGKEYTHDINLQTTEASMTTASMTTASMGPSSIDSTTIEKKPVITNDSRLDWQ